ncbi:MAG: hypothetical protein WC454_08080 [Phycisphaerae bacterium]|jgi:hypothetical protein
MNKKESGQIVAGALLRSRVRSRLEYLAASNNVTIQIFESKTWMQSLYEFVIEGEDKNIDDFNSQYYAWVEQFEK